MSLLGLFSVVTTCINGVKNALTPTISAEQWGNKELMHEDIMNGVSVEQQIKYAQQGRYVVKEKYPEPHRNERGQIMIENGLLYNQDLIEHGAVQTMKWAEQGKYILEGEALKKEEERIKKHYEDLINLMK